MFPFQIGTTAELVEEILDSVQLVIVARLIVGVVTQVTQIFHAGAASLDEREEIDDKLEEHFIGKLNSHTC